MSPRRSFSTIPVSSAPRAAYREELEQYSSSSSHADVNIKHNFMVQRFARHPYDLKTRTIVVSHPEGFLATLEWRWKDPNRDNRMIVAVTSGINRKKKLAIADACRAMLTRQKLIDYPDAAHNDAVIELEALMTDGKPHEACRILLQSTLHSELPLKSVIHILPKLWRHVISLHDRDLAETFISVLEHGKNVPVSLYESLIQELVYLSDFDFAEKFLLIFLSNRIQLSPPDRGFTCSGDSTSAQEIGRWKYWRTLVAIEELSNIHAALKTREELPFLRLEIDSATTLPLIQLRSNTLNDFAIALDSLVVLSPPEKSDRYLTGRVSDMSTRPDGQFVLTVTLLSGERDDQLFLESYLDVIVLAESRVTFDRINACLREFYRVSPIPELGFRFDNRIRSILLNPTERVKPLSLKSSPMSVPDLAKQKRALNLSEVQLAAVIHALSHPVTLIHGPAGTGKTHTLCGIVSAWRINSESRILCCADSNTAVDNIYESLRRQNIPAFRLSSWKALADVPEELLCSLPNKGLVDKYRGALKAYLADPAAYKGFLIAMRKKIEEEALREFKVVVTTLSSARNPILDKHIFPYVIIDESAQTMEPAALLAVSHGCERLVLIGDHKQLPAVVISKEASRLGLDTSLFERIITSGTEGSCPLPSVLLNSQRRMHPSISEWPNKSFYDGKLEDHMCVLNSDDGEISAIFPGVAPDRRVWFIDTDGLGSEELVGTSTRNLSECTILGDVVERLIGTNKIKMNQIGVIVPYLAQKQVLISELKKRNLLSGGIQINTVEGFQGHEKDYIIISTTRSNAVGVLGFIEDDKRMNVMLTRARKGLIVVGDQKTLNKGNRWSQWLEWCNSNGTVITAKKFHNRKM